jgi:hypothetical protein
METVKEFIDAVKEMRDAQVAYSLFPSGENKRRKENHEKIIDNALSERERRKVQGKQEVLPL